MDASAGTGKTFTLGQRYRSLRENGVPPEELFFVTFTENGADEMNDRLNPDDATFIGTFHSMAHRLFENHSQTAALEFDDSFEEPGLVTDFLTKSKLFAEFFDDFRGDYHDEYPVLGLYDDADDALELLERMASRGVFPTREGWYGNGKQLLEGDEAFYQEEVDRQNQPNPGSNGPRQSDLRKKLGRYRNQRFDPGAPDITELRGGRGTKQVDRDVLDEAFYQNDDSIHDAVHTLYRSYLNHQIQNNYVTYSTMQGWAYVTLNEQSELRESLRREHVLIDEFQDTSPLQFKMGLMLCDETNLCVVGDYKQSIYSFQYADVENLRSFEDRLGTFAEQLGNSTVYTPDEDVTRISLDVQYRNAPSIRQSARQTLVAPATRRDSPDESILEDMPTLTDEGPDTGTVRTVRAEDEQAEYEWIVDSIGSMDPSETAVLARTRSVARDLYERLDDAGVPVAYEGGVNLFDNGFGRRSLAWLRVMENDQSVRGWGVILEDEGYGPDNIRDRLDGEGLDCPDELINRRDEAIEAFEDSPGTFVETLADWYNPEDDLVETIQTVVDDNETMVERSVNEWADYIERSIEEDKTVDPEIAGPDEAVRVMTIHGAKGSEFDTVYVAGLNDRTFPSSGQGQSGPIQFTEEFGLRADRTIVNQDGRTYPVRNWRSWVLDRLTSGQYNEERRLLYVATTRARNEVTFTAHSPSQFFETLDETADESLKPNNSSDVPQQRLSPR